ncbi:MAG: hypothetical protein WCH82_01085 [Mycobacteriaceae bacterium]
MWSTRLTKQIALAAGAAAVLSMGALTACSTDTKEKPAKTMESSESSASNAPSPTEKKVGGSNSFSPTVKAKPAPTALPGNVITGN